MPGIVKRREDKRNGVSSGGGGGIAPRRGGNNGNNRNRNQRRGGPGGGGGGGGGGTDPPERTLEEFQANQDTPNAWGRHWATQGVGGLGASGSAFDNWFKNDYYKNILGQWNQGNMGKNVEDMEDFNVFLGRSTNLSALQNAWRSQTNMTRQATGAQQARWQFF